MFCFILNELSFRVKLQNLEKKMGKNEFFMSFFFINWKFLFEIFLKFFCLTVKSLVVSSDTNH